MGSPIAPNERLYGRLERASELATLEGASATQISAGKASLKFNLPRQGVSLVVLSW